MHEFTSGQIFDPMYHDKEEWGDEIKEICEYVSDNYRLVDASVQELAAAKCTTEDEEGPIFMV
tara:strand:+ start:2234 stop:2422 length:189 start_codon:yes stop_codon:yes gene_type:complete